MVLLRTEVFRNRCNNTLEAHATDSVVTCDSVPKQRGMHVGRLGSSMVTYRTPRTSCPDALEKRKVLALA